MRIPQIRLGLLAEVGRIPLQPPMKFQRIEVPNVLLVVLERPFRKGERRAARDRRVVDGFEGGEKHDRSVVRDGRLSGSPDHPVRPVRRRCTGSACEHRVESLSDAVNRQELVWREEILVRQEADIALGALSSAPPSERLVPHGNHATDLDLFEQLVGMYWRSARQNPPAPPRFGTSRFGSKPADRTVHSQQRHEDLASVKAIELFRTEEPQPSYRGGVQDLLLGEERPLTQDEWPADSF